MFFLTSITPINEVFGILFLFFKFYKICVLLLSGLAEAGRESAEILRQMKELSASTKAANHIRKVRILFGK
jgi:hypothetical protein